MEPYDGFSFSQDLTSGLSQSQSQGLNQGLYSQMSQNSQSSDCTWYSGDSQSLSQSMGPMPQKRFDQMVPPSFPEIKKVKYNLPKWTKGLLKTAEENQKLKSHEILMKQQEENSNYLKIFVQDTQKIIAGFPELMAQMVKESTDFLAKAIEKQNDCLKIELQKQINDALGHELAKLKQQQLDNTFDTWNYLSEVKSKLDELKAVADDRKCEAHILTSKIDQCCEALMKVQQILEEKSEADANLEKVPSLPVRKAESAKEVLDETDSDDMFQVSISLRSRRKVKRRLMFQQLQPIYTSTPIQHHPIRSVRKLLDDNEMSQILSEE